MQANVAAAVLFTVSGIIAVGIVLVLCGFIFGWFHCRCMSRRRDGGGRVKQGSHLRRFKLRPEAKAGVYTYENDVEQGLRVKLPATDLNHSNTKGLTLNEVSPSKVPFPPDFLSRQSSLKKPLVSVQEQSVPLQPPANTYLSPTQGTPGRSPVPKKGLPISLLTPGEPPVSTSNSSRAKVLPRNNPPKMQMSPPQNPSKKQLSPISRNWPLQSPPHYRSANLECTVSSTGGKASRELPPMAQIDARSTAAPAVSTPQPRTVEPVTGGLASIPSASLGSLMIDGALHPAYRTNQGAE